MNTSSLSIASMSTYFDQNDYDDPFKNYISDEDFIYFSPDFTNVLEIKVQQNHAYLADNLFFNFDYHKVSYYTSNRRNYRTASFDIDDEAVGALITVSLDKFSEQYERQVYTFLDMFGFIGGLFDFMFFSGFILINFFIENSYLNDVLSRLYQLRVNDQNNSEIIQKDRHDNVSGSDIGNDDSMSKSNFRFNNIDTTFATRFKQEIKSRRQYSYNLCNNIKDMF